MTKPPLWHRAALMFALTIVVALDVFMILGMMIAQRWWRVLREDLPPWLLVSLLLVLVAMIAVWFIR